MTTKSTYRLKAGDMDRRWHVMDAAGRPLGRVAGEAARLLQGKHKPTFEPHMAMGDFVVVVNAKEVDLTGKKREQKVYYRHTGYPGGLRERSFDEQMAEIDRLLSRSWSSYRRDEDAVDARVACCGLADFRRFLPVPRYVPRVVTRWVPRLRSA